MGRCWSTSTSLRSEHGGRRPSREEVAPGEDGITNSSATTTTEDSNTNEMELNEGDPWVEMYFRQAKAAAVGRQHPPPARHLHSDVTLRLAGVATAHVFL